MGRKPYNSEHRRKFLDGGRTPVLTASDYVLEGLKFQLDGIEKGNIDNVWLDLRGLNEIRIQESQKKANAVSFPPMAHHFDVNEELLNNNNITVELVLPNNFRVNQGYKSIRFLNIKGHFGLSIERTNHLCFINGDALAGEQIETIKGCISISQVACVQNGFKHTLKDTHVNYNVDNYLAYDPNNGVRYEGDICAIRVYNRQLTDDEILYNQRVDNVRFNLGLDLNGGIQPYAPGRALTMSRNLALDEASPLESFDEPQTTEQEECVVVTER